ncbi:methyltransferase family protein [Cyclobacterium xiamenense]|uniref:methyltransferase family protein n=1 Tax=Cyclobacterium xiamenense TaxID=1297121 RepID=UPI0035CF9CFD
MALQEEFEAQGNWLFKYRSYIPIVLLLTGLALILSNQTTDFSSSVRGNTAVLAYIYYCIGLIGLLIRAYTIGYTPRNTSGRNTTAGQVADQLNTTGIYSTVRHPLYLGNFITWLAIAFLTGNFWYVLLFVLMYWLYYERIMFAEEQFLRRKFGKDYLNWAEKVPAFIPNIRHFKKSPLRFSIKKVLRKEKNGVFAYMLVFAVFSGLKQMINQQPTDVVFVILAILSGAAYVLLKILKYKTSLLLETDR